MRTVIIGASGQLGSDLMHAFGDWEPVGVDHAQVDIERPGALSAMLRRYRPEIVVNTAAFHDLERCELQPDRAFAVNALAVDGLAGSCAAAGAILVHLSTDYVFDGRAHRPYEETDATNPLSVYGSSKLAGEQLVRRWGERHVIVRTSGLYGIRGSSVKGTAFIERILRQAESGTVLRAVDDVTTSPSYTVHVARSIRELVDCGAFGTYHVANDGACTWYTFAREILRQAGLEVPLEAVHQDAFPSYARRPAFSPLVSPAGVALGLAPLPPWQDGIAAYLAQRSSRP